MCDQIRSFLRIWSHLLRKSLMENFIFCEMFLEETGKHSEESVKKTLANMNKQNKFI